MPGGVNADGTDSKNWLVFGAGAHKCIGASPGPSLPPPPSSPLGHRLAGQNYVYMHMSAVIGSAALFLNWEHEVTPLSEEIEIIATLFPKVRHEPTPSRRARAVKLTLPSLARRMAAGSSSASARSSTKLTSSSFLSLSVSAVPLSFSTLCSPPLFVVHPSRPARRPLYPPHHPPPRPLPLPRRLLHSGTPILEPSCASVPFLHRQARRGSEVEGPVRRGGGGGGAWSTRR